MIARKLKQHSGSVLIFALWVLGFLSVLALQLGFGIRQRINFVKRIEERSQLYALAEAGIQRALALVTVEAGRTSETFGVTDKMWRQNNITQFKNVQLNKGKFTVAYHNEYTESGRPKILYGVIDEESKLNINYAKPLEINRLLTVGLGMNDDKAVVLTDSIIGWRDLHNTELLGFYSDNYYRSLNEPYQAKNAKFEVLDELLLLKGMTKKTFEKLTQFITIYGEGKINFNSAPGPVLLSVGLGEELVAKILLVRQGPDGIEATDDDFVFTKAHHIVTHLKRYVEISTEQADQIDQLNFADRITLDPEFFMVRSTATLNHSGEKKGIICVFSGIDARIRYWREY